MSGYLCLTSYTEAIENAERRLRRGERQVMCTACGRWFWPGEGCDHGAPFMSEREWKRSLQRAEQGGSRR